MCLASYFLISIYFLLNIAYILLAAANYNICRRNGVQGTNTDFLICAIASIEQFG